MIFIFCTDVLICSPTEQDSHFQRPSTHSLLPSVSDSVCGVYATHPVCLTGAVTVTNRSPSTTISRLTTQRPKDDTVSEGDTCQQESVAGLTKVNPEVPRHNTHPQNQTTSETPSTVQCVQVNLRKSQQALVSLFLGILNKNVYKNGIDVIFITEPPNVTKANTLTDVPDDVFNVFAEKYGMAALMTKGMTTWKCPQFCAKDIAVCQTKLNNRLTYLVSLYLDGKVHDFPNEFKELIKKKKVIVTLS